MFGLAGEILRAAEQRRIEHLHADVRRPAFDGIRAAVSRQALRQCLDQQPERVALVAMVEATDWQQPAFRFIEQDRGIVGGIAKAVEHPLSRQLAAFLVQAAGQSVRGDRH